LNPIVSIGRGRNTVLAAEDNSKPTETDVLAKEVRDFVTGSAMADYWRRQIS
jgi:hypothetical protein